MVFLRLDTKVTPNAVYGLRVLWSIVKWVLKLFTLFNVLLLLWVLYFNTPLITAKVLLGLIVDFFKVAFETYKDYVARFFDYVISAADNGLKSVPKHPDTPVEYPDGGFIKQYREIFQMVKDLPPRPDYGESTRWYDFLRDKNSLKPLNPIEYLDPDNKTGSAMHSTFTFIKDHWYFFAIGGGVVVLGGALWIFWTPITTGVVAVGSFVKSGVVAVGSLVKSGFDTVVDWFSSGGAGTAPGGADSGTDPAIPLQGATGDTTDSANPILGEVDNTSNIPLDTFTPRNRNGVHPLTDEDIQVRLLSLKMPDSPRTPISLVPTESGDIMDLNSPLSEINPNLWGDRNSPIKFGAAVDFYSPGLDVPAPWGVPAGDVAQASDVASLVSSNSSNSLGLTGLFPDIQGSAQSVNQAASPIVEQALVRSSPVLSQLDLSSTNFSAPSPSPIPGSFPSGPLNFPASFGSPSPTGEGRFSNPFFKLV